MAISVELTDVLSGFLTASATTANNTKIEEGFAKALSREPAADNAMETVLDMGGYPITNIAYDADDETSAVTKAIFDTLAAEHTTAMNAIQDTTEGFRDEAETFKNQAGTSASAAQTAQTAAELAETNAATSETNAASSATAASNSKSAAATSATNAQASYESILSHYYGAYSSDPATNPNGDPVSEGDVYYNTVDNSLKVYDLAEGWLTVIAPTATTAPELVWSGTSSTRTGGDGTYIGEVTDAEILSNTGHVIKKGWYVLKAENTAPASEFYFAIKVFDEAPTVNTSQTGTGVVFASGSSASELFTDNSGNHTFSVANTTLEYNITEIYYFGDMGAGSNAVTDVFGRTGNVIAEAGDYSADQVTYDNTTSGLTATNTKAAIDEVYANTNIGDGQSYTLAPIITRAIDTGYVNTTGRSIFVTVYTRLGTNDEVGLSVDSVFISRVLNENTAAIQNTLHAIVPAGSDYRVTTIAGTPSIEGWAELV